MIVPSSQDEIQLLEVTEKEFQLFKLIGSEDSIDEYVQGRILNNESHERSDWSAIYMQFNEAHSLSTVSDRFEYGYDYATLVSSIFQREKHNIKVYIVNDKNGFMVDHSITGTEKAEKLKRLLDIPATDLLMDSLGKKRIILLTRESENEWEFVVPESLFNRSLFSTERKVSIFKPGKCIMLGYRKLIDQEKWNRFDDSDVRSMPNNPPTWFENYVSSSDD